MWPSIWVCGSCRVTELAQKNNVFDKSWLLIIFPLFFSISVEFSNYLVEFTPIFYITKYPSLGLGAFCNYQIEIYQIKRYLFLWNLQK
jgi:hypothetical protein